MKKMILLMICSIGLWGSLHAQLVITLNVATAGTLSTLISSTKKYQITNLVLTGNLNTDDFIYIGEMAGRSTSGVLSVLDLSGARIVTGADKVISYGGGYSSSYDVVKTNKDEVTDMLLYDCDMLSSITLPDSVTKIGSNTFRNCLKLTSLRISDRITSIGVDAFRNCTLMSQYNVDSNNAYFCSIDSVLYNKSQSILMAYPSKKSQPQFVIPNSVITIAQSAFFDCDMLTSVTIGDKATSIESGGFYSCTNLKSIVLGKNIASIGVSALQYCPKLTEISCNSLTPPVLGLNVFSNGINLSTCKLYIPKGTLQTYWLATGWGDFTNIIEVVLTGIEYKENAPINIISKDGNVQIRSKINGEVVSVYSEQGKLILKTNIGEGITNIKLSANQLYLLRINNKTYKVVM
jgi:hypothetical protein